MRCVLLKRIRVLDKLLTRILVLATKRQEEVMQNLVPPNYFMGQLYYKPTPKLDNLEHRAAQLKRSYNKYKFWFTKGY